MARKGNQNPTRSIILSTKKSDYKEAIELYEKSGRKAQKWQVNLCKAIFSRNTTGKSKNLWVHTKFGYSLPRRNGKNEVVAIRELWGLMNGEQMLHTAHRTTTSHAAWERLCKLLDWSGIEYTSIRAKGNEEIKITDMEGRIFFRTRTSLGGLGEGFDLLVIDEAQEYTDDQESALKYVVTDSKNPQTLFCGTPPTPLSSGTIFFNMRNKTLEGGVKNTGWAEWSVDSETDPYDEEAWYRTNPSLGTIFTVRSIEDEIGSDTIDFNIQRLGLWLQYNQKSAISATDWLELKVAKLPKFTGKLHVGIKYGIDGTNVSMSVAVKTEDENIFVEAIDCRSIRIGNDWILDFLNSSYIEKVIVDGAAQTILADEMKEIRLKPPILPTVKEFIVANQTFERGIYKENIRHADQPSLTQVVTNCEKRNIGQHGGFGFKAQYEENDISLLDSIVLAYWSCSESKPVKKQRISY